MKIESIRLKNYKVFRDVHLTDIPSFLVVVGANGSGKSTLFDVFGFLHDCLRGNVRQALGPGQRTVCELQESGRRRSSAGAAVAGVAGCALMPSTGRSR